MGTGFGRARIPGGHRPTRTTPRAARGGAGHDDVLVLRARHGDREALEELLRTHRPRVLAIARRIVGDTDEAEDVAQETLHAVSRTLASFRGGAAFTTWIHRVATNHALNHLRSCTRRDRGEGRAADADALDRAERRDVSPPALLEDDERRERVRAAIEGLEPLFRACVLLRDVEGLAYDEIAARTRLPEGTVKSRIHRARKRLLQHLYRR